MNPQSCTSYWLLRRQYEDKAVPRSNDSTEKKKKKKKKKKNWTTKQVSFTTTRRETIIKVSAFRDIQ